MKKDRPNILLIMTDQQRWDTIHAGGASWMKTPYLDQLAQEGRLYRRCYSPNPVCIPARHNILTGLPCRWHTFDDNYFDDSHVIPYSLATFPQILSDAGYATAAVGKMHFQPYRRHNGFEWLYLMDEIPRYEEDDDYTLYLKSRGYHLQSVHGVRHLLYMQPQESLVKEEDHGSSWVAAKAIECLHSFSKDRPFLLWASFIAPHPPFDVPASYAHLYDDAVLPELPKSETPLCDQAIANQKIAVHPGPARLRRMRELYYASISFVDHNIGRILQALAASGLAENTLVIFCSDHGEMLGDFGTYQKFLPYDGSSRVPLILRWPNHIQAGEQSDELVNLNDLLPTILSAAGLSYPDPDIVLPGMSLLQPSVKRTYQYLEHQHGSRRWVCVMDERYKYTYHFSQGMEELYDTWLDPRETVNLAAARPQECAAVRQRMRQEAVRQEQQWGLPGTVVDGDFVCLPKADFFSGYECNPPVYPASLNDPQQKAALWPLEKETAMAIRQEPLSDPADLDLPYFVQKGILSEKDLQDWIRRSRTTDADPDQK